MRNAPNGYILYEGPSMLDGSPIVAIATGFSRPSQNPKTGTMIQTWIIRSDMRPVRAINTGDDVSICGDCPMRGFIERENGKTTNRGRSCYVAVQNAPTAIYDSYLSGNYPMLPTGEAGRLLFRYERVRLGAYGDPTAVPYRIWTNALTHSDGHTGYTHQWRNGKFWRFKNLLMASVETYQMAKIANAKGWRTFRSRKATDEVNQNEVGCPASAEMDYQKRCDRCMLCDGIGRGRKSVNVSIIAHGGKGVVSNYQKQFANN